MSERQDLQADVNFLFEMGNIWLIKRMWHLQGRNRRREGDWKN